MAIKFYNPTSWPARRSVIDYKAADEVHAGEVAVRGTTPRQWAQSSWRNHREAHGRRQQAVVSHDRLQAPQGWRAANVESIEYDPNRSCFIALIKYEDGEKAYIWHERAEGRDEL